MSKKKNVDPEVLLTQLIDSLVTLRGDDHDFDVALDALTEAFYNALEIATPTNL